MGSPPPRVARDKNLLDLVPTDTSDSDDERGQNESTQEEDISPPARNTRSHSTILSIMDEVMLSCCQISRTSYQIDPLKAATRKHPLKTFCEMAVAVLDEDTGYFLEYRHLVKHPNHKQVWGGAFGK